MKSMLRRAVLSSGISLALAIAGCDSTPQTQLIVVIDTDYTIPTELDAIDLSVRGPDGMSHVEHQPMVTASALPYTIAVLPTGAALGPVELTASGLHAGTTVTTRTARVTLIAQQTVVVTLYLLKACDASHVTCMGETTCGDDGRCHSIDVTTPIWTGTAPRIGTDAGAPFDSGVHDAGAMRQDANLPDTNSDANLPDANLPDAYSNDASTDCHSFPCVSDGNPCTDDVCGPGGTCTYPNNSNGCDDGMFCDGTDLCGAGSCSVHSGDPCGGAACNESERRCGSCAMDSDCPAPIVGGFDACAGFSDACTLNGQHSRSIQTFHCTDSACVATPSMDTQACTRASTDGIGCGASTCAGFGACGGFASECATGGTYSRSCTDFVCGGGTCNGNARTDTQACSRATDGMSCGTTTTCGSYTGSCLYDVLGSCTTTDMQSRACTDYTCGSGACNGHPRTEMAPCPVAPVGTNCTDTTTQCGVWQCNAGGYCAPVSGQCTGIQICCMSDAPARCTAQHICDLSP